MLTQKPKGTADTLGKDVELWQYIENTIRNTCQLYGTGEIRTPIFEHTELFTRGVGESSDIVQKEMYTFLDKGDRSITLKPEGTAGVARAFIERKLYAGVQPTKFYYITPVFRYENPQAGRLRQFHQFGVEFFGCDTPYAEAEVISLANQILLELGITNITLHINSLGENECRKNYRDVLLKFLDENNDKICPTCQARAKTNPLRTLDCKNPSCIEVYKNAPKILDYLGPECFNKFSTLQKILNALNIPFVIDSSIVRGLDYYTGTVFEFICNDIGAQSTVCGGGRYNDLIEECGGPKTSGVGFGMGMERLILTMESLNLVNIPENSVDVFVGSIGEEGFLKSQTIANQLRLENISCESDLIGRSVKAQMKYADKIHAKYSVILGDNEIAENKCTLKDMETGTKYDIELSNICEYLSGKLKA